MRWTSLILPRGKWLRDRSGAPWFASVLALPSFWPFLESGQQDELGKASLFTAFCSGFSRHVGRGSLSAVPTRPAGFSAVSNSPGFSAPRRTAVRFLPCPPWPAGFSAVSNSPGFSRQRRTQFAFCRAHQARRILSRFEQPWFLAPRRTRFAFCRCPTRPAGFSAVSNKLLHAARLLKKFEIPCS